MDEMQKIGVILAGAQSTRMGRDKAFATVSGARLIDLVRARIEWQVDTLLISGNCDYETGLSTISDLAEAPPGPAAGLYSICERLMETAPAVEGFFTAPVDAPFVPCDLVLRLGQVGIAIICSSVNRELRIVRLLGAHVISTATACHCSANFSLYPEEKTA